MASYHSFQNKILVQNKILGDITWITYWVFGNNDEKPLTQLVVMYILLNMGLIGLEYPSKYSSSSINPLNWDTLHQIEIGQNNTRDCGLNLYKSV